MTTQTVQTAGIAAMPRVDLMPPEIAEAARFRRLQLAMGCAVIVSAVLVGGLYQHTKSSISNAQAQVNTAQAQNTALTSKLNSLSNVSATFASVQAKQALLTQAMGQEVRWSYLLNDLSFRTPSNVWLTTIQATETSAGGTSATTTSTGEPVVAAANSIGTVEFSGVGIRNDDVAAWLDALGKEKGLSDPTFSNSTENRIGARDVVDFLTAATLTDKALSNRYANKAGS